MGHNTRENMSWPEKRIVYDGSAPAIFFLLELFIRLSLTGTTYFEDLNDSMGRYSTGRRRSKNTDLQPETKNRIGPCQRRWTAWWWRWRRSGGQAVVDEKLTGSGGSMPTAAAHARAARCCLHTGRPVAVGSVHPGRRPRPRLHRRPLPMPAWPAAASARVGRPPPAAAHARVGRRCLRSPPIFFFFSSLYDIVWVATSGASNVGGDLEDSQNSL